MDRVLTLCEGTEGLLAWVLNQGRIQRLMRGGGGYSKGYSLFQPATPFWGCSIYKIYLSLAPRGGLQTPPPPPPKKKKKKPGYGPIIPSTIALECSCMCSGQVVNVFRVSRSSRITIEQPLVWYCLKSSPIFLW